MSWQVDRKRERGVKESQRTSRMTRRRVKDEKDGYH